MNVRKKSETTQTITLEWDPVPGASGFRFWRDDKAVSHTWDATRTSVRMAKAKTYKVEAMGVIDDGVYPSPNGQWNPAGFCTYTGRMTSSGRRAWLDRVHARGVTQIREDFTWSGIERIKGQYEWSAHDSLVIDAADRGIRILAICDYAPAWANGGKTDDKYPPLDAYFEDYAVFAGNMAFRYPELLGIEIWNEPWHPGFWKPSGEPARYAALAKLAGARIKQENPAMRVGISGDLHYTQGPTYAGPWLPWLETLTKLDCGWDNIDFVSTHPYNNQTSPYVTGIHGLPRAVELDRILKAAGKLQPQWVTEWGYQVPPLNEATHKTWVKESLDRLHDEWAFVERSFCFHYSTGDGEPFNLVRPDGTDKPAAAEFALVTKES